MGHGRGKAYAKFRGSYNEINKGGFSGSAMEELTGKDSRTQSTVSTSIDQIAEWDKKGYAVTTSSLSSATNKNVVARHAYYLMDVDTEKRTVTMGNPWGFGHVTLSENEFKENYSKVYVNSIR